MVVHSQVSPLHCFLGYCKKESKWLQDSQSIVKYPLSEFTLSMLSTKKHDKVMKLDLPLLTVELSFDSQTKMDQYFKILSGVSSKWSLKEPKLHQKWAILTVLGMPPDFCNFSSIAQLLDNWEGT